MRHAMSGVEPAKQYRDIALSHDERLPQRRKVRPQCVKAFRDEAPLPGRRVGRRPVIRLVHIEWQDRALPRRSRQRSMVMNSQIPFEPDNLQHHSAK
jgi:hypothetical protein